LKYVAGYTHSVAISNNRLLDIHDEKVRFLWKDYRNENRNKTMTLAAHEFIRRFLLHVLPEGFQRIRYYGFLANRYREQKLTRCRELLKMRPPEPKCDDVKKDYRDRYEDITGHSLKKCPACHKGEMKLTEFFDPVTAHAPILDTS
jgi:Putative transposase